VTLTAGPERRRRRLVRATAGVLVLASLLGTTLPARAQALDPASASALAETLRILGDPSARGSAVAGNPGASDIDRQVQSLGGSPENSQAVYNLAGEVLADLVRSTGGDTGKLLELLQRAQTDPNGFADALSPTTLQHLRELSTKMSDTKR
jgi:hypothetical protein